jgi:hypothetical protein
LLIIVVLIIVLVIQSRVKEWMHTKCPPACRPSSHPLSACLPPFPPFTTFILILFHPHVLCFFPFSVA